MRTYRVHSEITISVFTDVEARSPAEAEALALDRGVMYLCHVCASGDAASEWVTSGELDGSPSGATEINEVEP